MKTATLKLETIARLTDGLCKDFDESLTGMVADCKRRPGLAKVRTVTLELKISPHPDDADDVLIVPVVKSKMPARQLDPVTARHAARNQLQFDFEDD